MPAYPGQANSTTVNTAPPLPKGIYPGDSFDVIGSVTGGTFETFVAGQSSMAVALGMVYENDPGSLSVEIVFSGAPGTFEVDLQTADDDADAFYTIEGSGISALTNTPASVARAEFNNVSARFARVFIKTLTNAVNIAVRICRR